MPLAAGMSLGPYEIIAALGAGGMGEGDAPLLRKMGFPD